MRFSIANLSDGHHDYSLMSDPEAIGLAENFDTTVQVHLTLEKAGRQYFLKARINTKARFQCDRCLEELTRELENSYRMFYVLSDAESLKHKAEEVTVIAPDTTSIDISEDVRQYLLLAVPLKVICRDKCRGLCPQCGENLNHGQCSCSRDVTDPRWDTLKKLLKD